MFTKFPSRNNMFLPNCVLVEHGFSVPLLDPSSNILSIARFKLVFILQYMLYKQELLFDEFLYELLYQLAILLSCQAFLVWFLFSFIPGNLAPKHLQLSHIFTFECKTISYQGKMASTMMFIAPNWDHQLTYDILVLIQWLKSIQIWLDISVFLMLSFPSIIEDDSFNEKFTN